MGELSSIDPKRMHKDNAYVSSQEVGERCMMKFWYLWEAGDPSWGKETEPRNMWILLRGGWISREGGKKKNN